MNSYKKTKSAAKIVVHDPEVLKRKTLAVMKVISDIVGSTLGPSGRPVLIERQEYGLPNILTKDGVTVFRSLGFRDPVSHAIMESARDASTKTVAKAGDGTTTATVLSYGIIKNLIDLCETNRDITPQGATRELERLMNELIIPFVDKSTIKDMSQKDAWVVANVSANGDTKLADAVIECFDIAGNDGAIIITEESGPSGYSVEHIEGYSIEMGYEESTLKFQNLFINDRGNNRIVLDKPVFLLYNQPLTDPNACQEIMEAMGNAWANWDKIGLKEKFTQNIVVVAPQFSESVLGIFGSNTANPNALNIVPLVCTKTGVQNSEIHFLEDLAAVTGAAIFDPISKPLVDGTLRDLGYGIKRIEFGRFKTTIQGLCEPEIVKERAEELRQALKNAVSQYDAHFLEDRIARLNGGIAKLKVKGSSSGEIREKKDRAEDAIAAVRGALKEGCLPGGGWALAQLSQSTEEGVVFRKVLKPALLFPIQKLLENCGYNQRDADVLVNRIIEESKNGKVFDAVKREFIDPKEGLLDSTPAVLEALRNSLSISSILGTLGGIVVFERDDDLERAEASDSSHFMKSVGLEGQDA